MPHEKRFTVASLGCVWVQQKKALVALIPGRVSPQPSRVTYAAVQGDPVMCLSKQVFSKITVGLIRL